MSADLIAKFGRQITVERTAAGTYSDETGLFQKGTTSTFTVTASVQPMSAREMRSLLQNPEGNRSAAWIKVYCAQELFTDRSQQKQADRLVIDGRRYKVMNCQNYAITGSAIGLPYFRVEAVNADEEGGQAY